MRYARGGPSTGTAGVLAGRGFRNCTRRILRNFAGFFSAVSVFLLGRIVLLPVGRIILLLRGRSVLLRSRVIVFGGCLVFRGVFRN